MPNGRSSREGNGRRLDEAAIQAVGRRGPTDYRTNRRRWQDCRSEGDTEGKENGQSGQNGQRDGDRVRRCADVRTLG